MDFKFPRYIYRTIGIMPEVNIIDGRIDITIEGNNVGFPLSEIQRLLGQYHTEIDIDLFIANIALNEIYNKKQ